MKTLQQSENSRDFASHKSNGNSANAISRLRILISGLINEVESLDQVSLSHLEAGLLEHCDSISFYEAVTRFEIALIKNALRRTQGHQLQAARLLNMNATTLNHKIKQYQIKQSLEHGVF